MRMHSEQEQSTPHHSPLTVITHHSAMLKRAAAASPYITSTKHRKRSSISRGRPRGRSRHTSAKNSSTQSESEDLLSCGSSPKIHGSPPIHRHHKPHASTSKYNFLCPLDPDLDAGARINILQTQLSDLRKTYMELKSEVAQID